MHIKADDTLVWRTALITINGAELGDVIEADDDEGWVVRLKRDRDGEFIEAGETGYATEKICGLKGKLKIRLR